MLRLSRFPLKLLVSFFLLTFSTLLFADDNKRSLEHADYDHWNTLSGSQISSDGNWIMYSIVSGDPDSDTQLVIQENGNEKRFVIQRGRSARFTMDSKYAIYEVAPDPKQVKKLKKEKANPKMIPTARMELLDLATGESVSVSRVKSFATPDESSEWLAYLLDKPQDESGAKEQKSAVKETYRVTPNGLQRPQKPQKLKKRPGQEQKPTEEKTSESNSNEFEKPQNNENPDKKKSSDKEKQAGTVLVVRNLASGIERRFPNVTRFQFSKQGDSLAFVTSVKQNADEESDSFTDGVHVLSLGKQSVTQIISGVGNYRNLAFSDSGKDLVFITDKDDYESETSSWSVYHWKRGLKAAKKVASEESEGIAKGWWISPNSNCFFSDDTRRLFFETAPIPEAVIDERKGKKEDAENDEEEKNAQLDVWHWQDPLLQPQQLLQAEQEKRRSYVATYNLRRKKIIQLADREYPTVLIDPRSKSDIAVGFTNLPYRKMMSWDIPGFQDSYLVDLKTGERSTILEKSKSSARLSPHGKFATWFDAETKKWFAASTGDDRTPVEISKGINFPLQDELHDTPSLPGAYGSGGWLDNDAGFLIYDRFDIWQVDPTGSEPPVCLTEGVGRNNHLRFRIIRLDLDEPSIDPKQPWLLSAFNEKTKASGFYRLVEKAVEGESKLHSLLMLDESLGRLTKAENTDDLMFTRSTFQKFPDIWTSTTEFKKVQRISDSNPQQENYLWGTSELVHWTATDGQELDGILYKPENFDPNEKYPLMVYFYERNSDTLHRYYTPAAGRSIINHSFYVSRGYVVFVPDIPYKTGEPGPSAANAVLPGTQSIIDMGFIDEKRVGMQGHSWGGYQTAYLVTQTDMFACAESGAPVSNMTSAYGGIRWGSGMSRMFQYERTQSRIGETLWEAREKYIANSPLFYADKINTPLLILHNDEDGAVPWYQGIELFVALRRLEKPAWLLNYNGNPHWVMGQENRRDFAIRMQQFFDHYLKGEPEPEWMAFGVPAVDKGEKKMGLELLEPKKESKGSKELESESND